MQHANVSVLLLLVGSEFCSSARVCTVLRESGESKNEYNDDGGGKNNDSDAAAAGGGTHTHTQTHARDT